MAHDHEQCLRMLSSLSEYVDGTLETVICAEIEQHMSECENCRIVVDTLRKTVTLYQMTNDPPDVPEEVRQRLFRRLDLDAYLNK